MSKIAQLHLKRAVIDNDGASRRAGRGRYTLRFPIDFAHSGRLPMKSPNESKVRRPRSGSKRSWPNFRNAKRLVLRATPKRCPTVSHARSPQPLTVGVVEVERRSFFAASATSRPMLVTRNWRVFVRSASIFSKSRRTRARFICYGSCWDRSNPSGRPDRKRNVDPTYDRRCHQPTHQR